MVTIDKNDVPAKQYAEDKSQMSDKGCWPAKS